MKVSVNSGDVGGPSAGLAYTLAIIDQLTPGSLTGGKTVAVTGTMELDGSVGEVGGVYQKTLAAISAGATLMVVPTGEYRDAIHAARGRIRVEKADRWTRRCGFSTPSAGTAPRSASPAPSRAEPATQGRRGESRAGRPGRRTIEAMARDPRPDRPSIILQDPMNCRLPAASSSSSFRGVRHHRVRADLEVIAELLRDGEAREEELTQKLAAAEERLANPLTARCAAGHRAARRGDHFAAH